MTVTRRGKRTAYDNISSANAAGRELPILGETVSVQEVYGGGCVVSTSNAEKDITNIVVDRTDETSTSDAEFQGPENIAVGENPPDELPGSSNTPGFATNP